jgi:hypothetical protein
MSRKKHRILWVLNHKTLMPFETSALIELGYEVFVPKIIPATGFRSGAVTFEFDHSLTIPPSDLARLNSFNFYEDEWPPHIERLVNRYFACTFIIPYGRAVIEAVKKFDGQIVFRTFGLDEERTYSGVLSGMYGAEILLLINGVKDRFWFGEGYQDLHKIERRAIGERPVFLPIGVPDTFFSYRDTWRGGNKQVLFIAPNVVTDPYYAGVYRDFKQDIGEVPHAIAGYQDVPVGDPHVLGLVPQDKLVVLFQECSALYYHSREPRHVHYVPIEAAIYGLPVVYYEGSLFDHLCPESTLGRVSSSSEARAMLRRLVNEDPELVAAVKRDQSKIADVYARQNIIEVWRTNLAQSGLADAIKASATRGTFVRSIKSLLTPRLRNRLNRRKITKSILASPTLAKLETGASIYDGVDFAKADLPPFVLKSTGLSFPEPFGRWSNGKKVELTLSHLLDPHFTLELTAFAYGDNVGRDVLVKVGNVMKRVRFDGDLRSEKMTISLRRATNRIEVTIPEPIRPPNDNRDVGIAFVRLEAARAD